MGNSGCSNRHSSVRVLLSHARLCLPSRQCLQYLFTISSKPTTSTLPCMPSSVKFCVGGRFCSLHQLYKKFSGNDVFPSPKLNEDQKKRSFPEIEVIFPPKSGEDQKKKSSPQFAIIFNRKFAGSFSPVWLIFLWSSSVQFLMGGRLNLDGGR